MPLPAQLQELFNHSKPVFIWEMVVILLLVSKGYEDEMHKYMEVLRMRLAYCKLSKSGSYYYYYYCNSDLFSNGLY